MFPGFSINNGINAFLGDVVRFPQGSKGGAFACVRTYSEHLPCCEFGKPVAFSVIASFRASVGSVSGSTGTAFWASTVSFGLSAFGNHIIHVVLMRPQKQMCRVYAKTIVTMVQHVKPVWDWSEDQLIRYSMCPIRTNPTITVAPFSEFPKNASGCCYRANALEELVFQRNGSFFMLTCLRTEFAVSTFDSGWFCKEGGTTECTRTMLRHAESPAKVQCVGVDTRQYVSTLLF